MGAYSTMDITRDDAIESILRELENATDEQISDTLFALIGDKWIHNFNIVENYSEKDTIQYRRP